ncbi:Uncharacterised protein [Vibrio cholerae]|nr:Uncharacterised protein [Vibrio cholerae]
MHWDFIFESFYTVRLSTVSVHIGINQSWANTVNSDTFRGNFQRQTFC